MAAAAATCVLAGARAVLIRGAPGAGKSRLALDILDHPHPFRFARLVGDDQVLLEARAGRLLARPAPVLAGRIEVRGLGIATVPFEPLARIALIIDLAAPGDAPRLPDPQEAAIVLEGVRLPRLILPVRGMNAPPVLRALHRLAAHDGLEAFWR